MSAAHSPLSRAGRQLLLLAGLGSLWWMRWEDQDASAAALLGLLGASALALLWLGAQPLLYRLGACSRATLLGILAGVGAAPLSAVLMLFKNAWHGHLFPDYPLGMVLALLERAPAWALAGALAGLALGLLAELALGRCRQA